LAAKKREREGLLALIAQKHEVLKHTNQELTAAKDFAIKSKLRDDVKTATNEAKAAEAAAKKLAGEIVTEQARVDKLAAEYERVKTASAGGFQGAKL
jgi:phage-related tail protein